MLPELEEIKRTLLNEWDPIGVSDIPGAADEYDSYAMPIFVMLQDEGAFNKVADYLEYVVTERMGMTGNIELSRQIARRLSDIHASHRPTEGD